MKVTFKGWRNESINSRWSVTTGKSTAYDLPELFTEFALLLLPLSLTDPSTADLALVVERFSDFYRASTCLSLDMAYNNAHN